MLKISRLQCCLFILYFPKYSVLNLRVKAFIQIFCSLCYAVFHKFFEHFCIIFFLENNGVHCTELSVGALHHETRLSQTRLFGGQLFHRAECTGHAPRHTQASTLALPLSHMGNRVECGNFF